MQQANKKKQKNLFLFGNVKKSYILYNNHNHCIKK